MEFHTPVTGVDACVERHRGNPRVQWVGSKERCTPQEGMAYIKEAETFWIHSALPLSQTMNLCVEMVILRWE